MEKLAIIELTSDIDVELIHSTGDDAGIAQAARVSTGQDMKAKVDLVADGKLINYLVKHRHGSPFEHNSMTFRVSAPIFVFREWMRHRIGWSYNEVSGRYKMLEPKFYYYPPERPLVQKGSSAHPELVAGNKELAEYVDGQLISAYEASWDAYLSMLEKGAANEVARAVLPVGLYSDMYVTCNARSLMSFMSLRIDDAEAAFETKPQWEIQVAARKLEEHFKMMFPATWVAFVKNGRVAP